MNKTISSSWISFGGHEHWVRRIVELGMDSLRFVLTYYFDLVLYFISTLTLISDLYINSKFMIPISPQKKRKNSFTMSLQSFISSYRNMYSQHYLPSHSASAQHCIEDYWGNGTHRHPFCCIWWIGYNQNVDEFHQWYIQIPNLQNVH